MTHRLSLLLLGSLASFACTESPSLGPPADGNTSPPITGGGGVDEVSEDDGSSGVDSSDTPGCDPFADPTDECGVGMDCDPSLLMCVAATGTSALGDECDVEGVGDLCSAGLTCLEGRCRSICDPQGDLDDPDAPGSCPSTDVCVLVESSWGICLTACLLALQDCETTGEACNTAAGADGLVAACTLNPGSGADAEPCSRDSDCLAGLLCTEQALHSTECASMAASCCTYVCDGEELPCAGIEVSCHELGIFGQEHAGFCGPE